MTVTFHVTVVLEIDERDRLHAQAQDQGMTVEEYVQSVIAQLARPSDCRALRALLRDERNRQLAIQANEAAVLCEADIQKLPCERELTAFSSLK